MSSNAAIFSLAGRVALITGASRGLGLEMARTLGAAGARLVITARKQQELQESAQQLRAAGLDVLAVPFDVGDVTAAATMVADVVRQLGQIDVLVNNAGNTWGAPAAEYPYDAWKKVMDVNLNGAWVLTQQVAVQSMLPRKTGSIIFVSSVMALGGSTLTTPTVAYNTAKAAQLNLTRSLAVEWAGQGVRVNALLPGWFPTKMTRGTLEKSEATLLTTVPLGRWGDPERDIGGPVLFLASDASRYMTGQTLVIDGGITAAV
jgi:NAD(P)-dependent dehydrogenase (short-subunit alcohol dehydrogenase family)